MARVNKKRSADTNPRIDVKRICEISKTSSSGERVTNFNWAAGQGEEVKLEVFQKFIAHLGLPIDHVEAYGLFCLAAFECHEDEYALSQKKKVTVDQGNEISRKIIDSIKVEKKKKGAPVASKIAGAYFHMISVWRDEELSWEDISTLLIRRHNLVATRSYVRRAFVAAQARIAAADARKEAESVTKNAATATALKAASDEKI